MAASAMGGVILPWWICTVLLLEEEKCGTRERDYELGEEDERWWFPGLPERLASGRASTLASLRQSKY